jgi:CheY-like chemotaxis protein
VIDNSNAPRLVLIVDDDLAIQMMLESVLTSEGYKTRTAANGQIALNLIEQEQPALIVLDLMMPVMDGWQFLEHLQGQNQAPPIILLSASRDLVNTAERHNVKAFLPKPFELEDFLSCVERFVR